MPADVDEHRRNNVRRNVECRHASGVSTAGVPVVVGARLQRASSAPQRAVLTCAVAKLTAVGTPGAINSTPMIYETVDGARRLGIDDSRGKCAQGARESRPARQPTAARSRSACRRLEPPADQDAVRVGHLRRHQSADGAEDPCSTFRPISGTKRPTRRRSDARHDGLLVGLTVGEQSAGLNNPNCPAPAASRRAVIDFHITPLPGSAFPDSFELTIQVGRRPRQSRTDTSRSDHNGELLLCFRRRFGRRHRERSPRI